MQAQPSPETKPTKFDFSYPPNDGVHVLLDCWHGDECYPLGIYDAPPHTRDNRPRDRVMAVTDAISHLPREIRAKIWADYWAQGHRRPR